MNEGQNRRGYLQKYDEKRNCIEEWKRRENG
jgi:hypothetical protein